MLRAQCCGRRARPRYQRSDDLQLATSGPDRPGPATRCKHRAERRARNSEEAHQGTERFFKGLALNVLIGGTDAHAKNYSLILIGHRAQVAPLYDVASAACYPQYERLVAPMRIGEHDTLLDVTSKDWERIGRRMGIAGDLAVQWVEDLRNDLPGAFERATEGLPEHTRAEAGGMADRIVEHVAKTWRPDLSRNPRYVASQTSTSRRPVSD